MTSTTTTPEFFHGKNGAIELPNVKLSNRKRSMLDLAVKLAEAGDEDLDHRHAAVITKGGRVMAVGNNKWRNKEMVKTCTEYNAHLTVHAEVDALSRVGDARGAVIYIARVNKHGEEKFSRPCDRCYQAIQEAGVKEIVFTTGN